MNLARLGDHAKFLSGFAFKSTFFNDEGSGLHVVRIRDVVRGHSETFYSGEYDDRYLVSNGDYLIGMDGEFNLARWQSESALLNQRVCKIDSLSEDVDREYLGRFLPIALKEIENATPFATVKHLSVKALNDIQIPLPPLAEQKRIAGVLDAADALRAKRRESLAQLDALLQSTFLDMFGDPVTNPMGWEQCMLGDVVHSAKDGPHVSPVYSEDGIPFLSTRHIRPGEVIWEDLRYIDEEEAKRQWKKCKPVCGDILYTKGGTTGLAARVTTSKPFAVWVHIALLKLVTEKVHPIWIEAMLNSAYCYAQSQRYTHGIANRDLGLKRMVKIQIYLPPMDEQQHFANVVESIEQQKASHRAHLAELDTLFASLQSRAFRGDL